MKKRVAIALLAIALMLAPVVWLVALNVSPFLYTKFRGDAGTQTLYALYRSAAPGSPVLPLLRSIKASKLDFIDDNEEGIISVHNDTATRSEMVLIWYGDGKVTGSRFTTEP